MRRPVLPVIVTGSCLALVAAFAGNAGVGDRTTSDLAARVQRLQAEAATPAPSMEVLRERLETLWEWGNALALAGQPLPLDFTAAVAMGHRAVVGAQASPLPLERLGTYIAATTREFAIKQDNPDAIGRVTLSPTGPFAAGDFVTVEETYTVGQMPMVQGGGIMLAQSTRWTAQAPASTELGDGIPDLDSLKLQTDDPAADNYVSIRCSNPAASFELEPPRRDWRTFNVVTFAFFKLAGADLRPGDTVTVVFGDTSGGSRGMRVQTWTNDRVLLPMYPDLGGKGVVLTPRWPGFAVVGRPEVRRLEAVAGPSILAAGDACRLAVRSLDRYRQVTTGATPAYQVLVDDRALRTIPAGSPAVMVLEDITLEEGVHRFEVRSADGVLAARSNPVWVRAGAGGGVWWGDTHGHSGFADGQGTPDNYFRFARDVSRLDFVTLSEHDIWLDDSEWRTLQETTKRYLAPGSFSTILGYEWTADASWGGHHNVYFRTPDDRARVANQVTTDLEQLYAGLRAANRTDDVLIIPHAHQPGDWRRSDPTMERLVEVDSGHGGFEWFGNRYLQNGWDLGFIGSSDDHTGHPGYFGMVHVQFGGLAAVLARANTPEDLFTAMRDRRTYATTGERIILDASLNGAAMGSEVPPAANRTVRCRVMGTEPVEAVDVVKNGRVIYSRAYLTPRIEPSLTLQVAVSSSSEVASYRPPRGPRGWQGSVEVEGAHVKGYEPPWFANPTRYLVRRDPADPDRLQFLTNTRGRAKGLRVELEGASEATKVRVEVDELGRTLRAGPNPASIEVPLARLLEGPVRRELVDNEDTDWVEVGIVPGDAALDLEFEFADLGALEPGDYYYLRVRQVGGGMAFSSPWRVTGTAAPGED